MNSAFQNALVEKYISSGGLLTEQDLGKELFSTWKNLVLTLYTQALELNRRDWDNPTELKECSVKDPIWDTIRVIYDEIIGPVNNHTLPRNTDLVCLLVAYAVKKRSIEGVVKISDQERFRWRLEYLLGREIISQREKTPRMIEDEVLDRKFIRSLRRRDVVKFSVSTNGDSHKIDFAKISIEGYEKVCAIANHPHRYKEFIDSEDENISKNFVLHFFGQLSDSMYSRSWAHILIGLGLQPTNRGIEFLAKKVHEKMQDIMFDCLLEHRSISPMPVIQMRFCQELYATIKEILDEKNIRKMRDDEGPWNEDSTLYVYKGRTSCHSRNHELTSATAIFTGRNDSEIRLNVEYCQGCGKFYISYGSYERYRERYSMLLGKIKMDVSSIASMRDIELSEFSPLRLCGYSVNQQDGYTRTEREYIISKVIEKRVLTKSEVIRYLEHFINMNGQKANNALALSKWKEDLDFTLKYKLSEQPEHRIRKIQKY